MAERKALGIPGRVVNAVIGAAVAMSALQILAALVVVSVGQKIGVDAKAIAAAAPQHLVDLVAGYEKPSLGVVALGGGEDDRVPL